MWQEYQSSPNGLEDLVNYAVLIAPGAMLLKDGALLTAWHFQGPDLDYAAPEEVERLSAHVSAAFTRCSDGWMLHVDLIRRPVVEYLPASPFPDPTSALIEEERRRHYSRESRHFSNVHALALTYCPPPDVEQRMVQLLYEGERARPSQATLVLDGFNLTVNEIEDLLGSVLQLVRMTDEELLTYLHLCVTGADHPVKVPHLPLDLDVVIADQEMVGGFAPQIGGQHVRVISLDGYPRMTEPGAQAFLHELPMAYRWSTRFIFLDRPRAERLFYTKRKYWLQKRKTFAAKMSEAGYSGQGVLLEQQDALEMAADASAAAAEAASGDVIFGLYTMTVVVMDEDEERAEHKAREVQKQVQRHGFGARRERANAVEAFAGTWPDHGYENVRRVPLHSLNLADLLPLTSIWAGQTINPNPYFPAKSPALMLTATAGQTPFYVTPYVGNVGHTLIVGPTQSGKSTLLAMMVAQFQRYPHAQVFWFDKGYASYALINACGGTHYDIGGDTGVAFTPLARVENEREREWTLEWLEQLLQLQGMRVTPAQQTALWRALTLLGESTGHRTMTEFVATLQDQDLRAGLQHYTLAGGAGSLLDAAQDSLGTGRLVGFEMEHLLARGDKDLSATLLYLFHRVEQRCQEGIPTLIPIDEAWLMLLRGRFGEKLEEWLRGLAKKNAAVLFVSQSLADIERCPQRHILVESCQTKIFLPNAEARTAQSAQLYQDLGLNERQIELLSYAIPKKHYLYTSPLGRRLFDMHLGPAALSFVGVGGREDLRRVQTLISEYGEDWPLWWLRARGCELEARWWRQWNTTHRTGDSTRIERHNHANLFAQCDGDLRTRRDGESTAGEPRTV